MTTLKAQKYFNTIKVAALMELTSIHVEATWCRRQTIRLWVSGIWKKVRFCAMSPTKNCAMPSFSSKWYAAKYGSWRFHCTVRCRSGVETAALTLDGHNAGISSVAFSLIGTHVASGDTDGVVKIWDLRKKKNKGKSGDIATLNESGATTSVAFDYGNKYVSATSGDIVKVWEFKKWDSTIFQHLWKRFRSS